MIGWTLGVGKTATGRALKHRLENCVLLDGDALWDMNPFSVTEDTKKCVISNIVACLSNFIACPQFDNIIFCWVMHREDISEAILSRLDLEGVRVREISLVCSGHTLLKRLSRDIDAGVRTADVKHRALEYLPLYRGLRTIKIDTEKLSPEQAAEVICSL